MSMGFTIDDEKRKPLEMILPPEKCADFTWVGGYWNGIQMYKNKYTGRYLTLNSKGQCFVCKAFSNYFVAVDAVEAIGIAYSLRTSAVKRANGGYSDLAFGTKKI